MYRMVFFSLMMSLVAQAHAQNLALSDAGPVQASLIANVDAIVPGESFTLGLRFKIKSHWHTYWINPGDVGTETSITFKKSDLQFGAIQWPLPKVLDFKGDTSFGYEDEVVHLISVQVPADLKGAKSITLEAKAEWLMCKTECVPGEATLKLTLPVRPQAQPANADLFKAWRQRLPVAADHKQAKQWIDSITQKMGKSGPPQNKLVVRWKKDRVPKNVQWLPIATNAVAINDIRLSARDNTTHIEFKPKIYKPKEVPAGIVGGLLLFADEDGQSIGIVAPIRVLAPKKAPEKASTR
jgi:DsbC/DsbD-like thiol-disulfide interchange protein